MVNTHLPHIFYISISLHALCSNYWQYAPSLSLFEAKFHEGWLKAMQEMQALHDNNTWELVSLPEGKHVVGCKWIYIVELQLNGFVERLKARLVEK